MLKKIALLCVLAVGLSDPAWAAKCLVGEYIWDDSAFIKVVVKDSATIRIDVIEDDEVDIYLLAANGKRWMTGRDSREDNWEVLDFDIITEAMAQEEYTVQDYSAAAKIGEPVAKTVGGFNGQAFAVEYPYDEDYTEEFTVVLSEEADVVTLTNALNLFLKDVVEDDIVMVVKVVERIAGESGKKLGLLEYEEFQLKSITKTKFADDYFTLPAGAEFLDMAEFLGN